MVTMSMNRAIHGAFRRDLERFVAALEAFRSGDHERARQLTAAWANFDDQLTRHHEGEHEIAWPALHALGVTKELLATMDAEHASMAAALTKTRAAMAVLAATPGSEQAQAALAAITELRAVTGEHLDHEESELEDLYVSKRDTPEMKAMGRAFAKVGPVRGGRFFAWVLDGASPEERAAVTGEVPGPVLAVLTGVFGRSYRRDVAPAWRN
jgi:hemerythrin-like domain-containing protein